MKLVTYTKQAGTEETVGVLGKTGDFVFPAGAAGCRYDTMTDLITHATDQELSMLGECAALDAATAFARGAHPADAVRILSPIPRPAQDVLCLGLNYTEHAAEAAGYSREAFSGGKDAPVFFSKRVTYSQGSGEIIPAHADITSRLDYECELAVILRKDALHVSPEEAGDYVFGYTILNDVSARDLQTTHKQWYFGKSLDGFTPMGPCIVTADEIAFPPVLGISLTVNGELRQDSSTAMLIHGIPEIISTLTEGMTLKAGTIIATGTPKGVAMGMREPQFLKAGDVVVCAIEGIGELSNTVA